MDAAAVRTRFAPSPTGYLHVGSARTALFDWLLARRHGGQFVLRIEDTDQQRNVADAEATLLEDLRWLGLAWDEGPDCGGPHGPYRQSERLDAYAAAAERLISAGAAYHTFETPEELEQMRRAAAAEKRPYRYARPANPPTSADVERARREGRPVVLRFKTPAEEIVVHDEVLGDVSFRAGDIEDFVLLKSNGWPTYHLAVVVDDEHMRITHVIRGQEHLMNTPKHVFLQRALGFRTPAYAHLPLVLNLDGSKMGKRDKQKDIEAGRPPREIDIHDFRCAGYLPEAIVNFIALLGWSPGDGREKLTREELGAAFSLERIGKTSARFYREKLLAFNTDYSAAADPDRLLAGFRDYAAARGSAMSALDDATLRRVLEVCRGFNTFAHVEKKTGMLFADDEVVEYDREAVRRMLERHDGAGYAMLARLAPALESVEPWTAERIEAAIDVCREQQGVKLADVAQPLRVAVTGGLISPAIGPTLALLGKAGTLARVRRCLALRAVI